MRTWTITQCFHQSIQLDHSKREKRVSARFWMSQQNNARSIKLGAFGSDGAASFGRPVAAEDLSSEKKGHLLPNTDGEEYIRKFDHPAKSFKPQTEVEHELHNRVSNSICARFGKYSTHIPDFPHNVAIWSQFTNGCQWTSSCLTKDHEDCKRMAMNTSFQGHDIWYSLYNDTQTHTTYQSCRTATHFDGQELRCWVLQQQNWSGWKFTCSQILHCVLESQIQIPPTNELGKKMEDLGERTWNCRKMNFGSPRIAIHSARTTTCSYYSNQDAYSEILERANSRIFRWQDHVHVHVLNDIEWTNTGASLGLRQKICGGTDITANVKENTILPRCRWHVQVAYFPPDISSDSQYFLGEKEEAMTICKGTFDNSKQFALYVQTNLAVVWHWKSGTYTENSGRRRATRSRTRAVDIDFP